MSRGLGDVYKRQYRKMDVTRERISCILELRKILLSIQSGFSLVSAAVAVSYTHLTLPTNAEV